MQEFLYNDYRVSFNGWREIAYTNFIAGVMVAQPLDSSKEPILISVPISQCSLPNTASDSTKKLHEQQAIAKIKELIDSRL